MSLSIVRTCEKCGLRSEKRVLTPEDVQIAALVLWAQGMPGAGEGCFECIPDLEHTDEESRASWERSIEFAYSHGPRPRRTVVS